MIYSGGNRITKLINAEALCWKAGTFDVLPRKVCALAFRVEGTADMTCAEKHFYIGAGDVLYMPQGLGYQVDYSDRCIAFTLLRNLTILNRKCTSCLTRENSTG